MGALDPFDHRLNLQNPISLTGSLDPNMIMDAGRQSTHKVDIGDYRSNTKTLLEQIHGSNSTVDVGDGVDIPQGALSLLFNKLYGMDTLNEATDYKNCRTYETSCRLINTICFHTCAHYAAATA